MSGLIDSKPDSGNASNVLKELKEATSEGQAPEAPSETPQKYQGKTKNQIIEMHQNAESRLGTLGNDLGHYRTLTDKLLDLKRTDDLVSGGAAPEAITISSTDLLDKPTESVQAIVRSEMELGQRQTQERVDAETAEMSAFNQLHPDAGTIVNIAEFQEWVQSSPIRKRAAQEAYNKNWESADVLMQDYKQSLEASQEPAGDPNIAAAKNAATESVGQSSASTSTGKIYRRLDLVRLKLEQPEVYSDPTFQDEILRAYAEGRVR